MGVKVVETAEDFKTEIAVPILVVVDFFAEWCGPCKMIAPKMEQMSNEFEGSVKFLKIDVDELEDVAAEYDVKAMPTFLFFKNGQKVDEVVGASEVKLREAVNKHK